MKGILIGWLTLGVILFLLWFGFSDFLRPVAEQLELVETKPWRPWARLIFSFVMLGITIVTAGLLLKAAYRNRS